VQRRFSKREPANARERERERERARTVVFFIRDTTRTDTVTYRRPCTRRVREKYKRDFAVKCAIKIYESPETRSFRNSGVRYILAGYKWPAGEVFIWCFFFVHW